MCEYKRAFIMYETALYMRVVLGKRCFQRQVTCTGCMMHGAAWRDVQAVGCASALWVVIPANL
jgi:hypothetical protein